MITHVTHTAWVPCFHDNMRVIDRANDSFVVECDHTWIYVDSMPTIWRWGPRRHLNVRSGVGFSLCLGRVPTFIFRCSVLLKAPTEIQWFTHAPVHIHIIKTLGQHCIYLCKCVFANTHKRTCTKTHAHTHTHTHKHNLIMYSPCICTTIYGMVWKRARISTHIP